MDNKTASEWLGSIKEYIHGGDEEFDRRRLESIDAGIQALKAQEPVSPTIKQEMDDICSCIDDVAYCGKCGAQIGRLKQNYCSNCGQAVKWE